MLAGCSQSKQPAPDAGTSAFQGISPVSAGNTLKYDTIAAVIGSRPVEPARPNLRITRSPRNFEAHAYRSNGRFSACGKNEFQFTAQTGRELDLQLNLPESMPWPLEGVLEQRGWLALVYETSPDGARESLELTLGKTWMLGYCWRTARQPLTLGDGARTLLRQVSIEKQPQGDALRDVRVQALADGGVLDLKPGEPVLFTNQGQRYTAFVQTSLFVSKADSGEDGEQGYLLQAVVVKGK